MPVLSGDKWGESVLGTSGGTVTYAFATAGTMSFQDSYYPDFGFEYEAQLSADYQLAIHEAFDAWELYADIEFEYTTDPESADICLGWDYIDGTSNVLADCTYWAYGTSTNVGEIFVADIRFDLDEDWEPFSADTDPSEISFETVAIHEIGHALGLEHNLEAGSIMNAYYSDDVQSLGQDDIEGIQAIYGSAYASGWGDYLDAGGWHFGWHTTGWWEFGWHAEAGWEQGWYITDDGWANGWFYSSGWENGWHMYGTWEYGWFYDYGGWGYGANQGYGWGGSYGYEDGGWYDGYGSGYGDHGDAGGWNFGWHTQGWWDYGWHTEAGWDYGWYETSAWGWNYGWFYFEGEELGWYGYGAWDYGWFYDYGGWGYGYVEGGASDGGYGYEDGGLYSKSGYGDTLDQGAWNYGWHTEGTETVGWHVDTGWEFGWYMTDYGWQSGWYFKSSGWEYGWHGAGSWDYGWFYDYGGWGFGYNEGADVGGIYGYEDAA